LLAHLHTNTHTQTHHKIIKQ